LGGVLTSSPSVMSFNQNHMEVVVRGQDEGVWTLRWDAATGWADWVTLEAQIKDSPGAVAQSQYNWQVYVRGMDDHVYERGRHTAPGGVTQWIDFGGVLTSSPSPVARGRVFVRGQDGAVWQGDIPPYVPIPKTHIDKFVSDAPGGYIPVGGSATLSWSVSNCEGCKVSLVGRDGTNYGHTSLSVTKLPNPGMFTVKPQQTNNKYTLTASGYGGTDTRDIFVHLQGPPPPALTAFYFKMEGDESNQIPPCFVHTVYAIDEATATQIATLAYGGYTPTLITAAEIFSACS
jgi:hypothetical protein